MELLLGDTVRCRQRQQHLFRTEGRIFRVLDLRKQYHEFIPALTAHGVRAAHTGHQALCDRLQQLVANRMSQGVVDVLEAIQIQKQHSALLAVTTGQSNRVLRSDR